MRTLRMPNAARVFPSIFARACAPLVLALGAISPALAQIAPAAPAAPPAPAPAVPPAGARDADGAVRFTLDNGLRVILRPIAGSDEAAILVLFNFGESSDPEGKSGLAHLVEHLYLTAPAGETPRRTYDELTGKYHGLLNAQTGEDYTVVATVVPAQSYEQELADTAARLRGPNFEQVDLDREKPRMLLELDNMFNMMPTLAARNQARERIRPSPAGARKGGVNAQIIALTLGDVLERREFYKPGNAILCIAGGIDPGAAEATVRALFSDIPKGKPAPPARERAKAAPGEPVALAALPEGNEPYAINAYDVPPPGDPMFAATTLLVSRLQQKLYKPGEKMPPVPPAQHPVLDDPYLLLVGVGMKEGETPEAAAARIDALVAEACAGEVKPEETQRIRLMLGGFLGLTPIPDAIAMNNPYGVAFSIARREQVKLNSNALGLALDALREQDMQALHAARLTKDKRAAVAVTPKRPDAKKPE